LAHFDDEIVADNLANEQFVLAIDDEQSIELDDASQIFLTHFTFGTSLVYLE